MYDVGYWKRVYDTKEVDFRIFEDSNLIFLSPNGLKVKIVWAEGYGFKSSHRGCVKQK